MSARVAASRDAPWWPAAAAGTTAALALGATLLVPRLFSDPVGVDPFDVRLAGVASVLAVASLLVSRLRPARPVLLAAAAAAIAYTVFAGVPQWIVDISGSRFDGNAQVLLASVAETVITVAVAVVAVRGCSSERRPLLRLRSLGWDVWLASALGSVAFVAVVLLLPATLLGREGIAPVALARDLPLQGPASVFQALAQELQFRGLLLGSLDRVTRPWVANVAQACAFGLAHIAVQYQGPGVAFVPVTVVMGLVLGWVTQRTGSLWPGIVIHAVADIAVTVAVIPGLYGY